MAFYAYSEAYEKVEEPLHLKNQSILPFSENFMGPGDSGGPLLSEENSVLLGLSRYVAPTLVSPIHILSLKEIQESGNNIIGTMTFETLDGNKAAHERSVKLMLDKRKNINLSIIEEEEDTRDIRIIKFLYEKFATKINMDLLCYFTQFPENTMLLRQIITGYPEVLPAVERLFQSEKMYFVFTPHEFLWVQKVMDLARQK